MTSQELELKNHIQSISLEINSDCNRKCAYCPLSLIKRPYVTMDAELIDKIIHELMSINYDGAFCLNIYNEPLIHFSFLLEVITKIKKNFPASNIFFSTNGDFLTKPKLDYLVSKGLSRLTITCHQNSFSQENAINLVKQTLQKLKIKKYALPVQKNYIAVKVMYSSETGAIPIRIFSSNFIITGQNRANTLKDIVKIPAKYERKKECTRPKTQLTIAYDGSVYPCCMFCHGAVEMKYKIGNCMQDTLAYLYGLQQYEYFKKMGSLKVPYESPCSECTE